MARPAALALLILSGIADASLAQAANSANGGRLARRWCATCHLVSTDQRQANTAVPTFAAIARVPGFTPERVAFFLLSPHPPMPDMALSRREAEDIAAYIESLR